VESSAAAPRAEALARVMVRARWWVLAAWAVGIALAAVAARGAADRLDVRGGSLAATEASRSDAVLATRFRQDEGETFVVVLSGTAARHVLDSLSAAVAREPYVRHVESVLPADSANALLLVTLNVARPDSVLRLVEPVRAAVRGALARTADGADVHALVTGDTPLERDMLTVTTADVARSERRLVPVAAVILLIACGSMLAAALPLALGFGAITVALAVVALLTRVLPMSIYVLHVTTMIGLGVGIDYALLVVTRFREELGRGTSVAEAVTRTVGTAGTTIVTSGLCVAAGFAGLVFTPLVETRSIGIGGLVVVVAAVALALTALPALLAVLGPRVARRVTPGASGSGAAWERWARAVTRHAAWALVAAGLVLAALTAPLAWLRVGVPARHWWPAGTEAGDGLAQLARLGGAGDVQPIRVVVDWPPGRSAVAAGALRGLRALSDSLAADQRVRTVRSLVDLRPRTSLLEYALLYSDLPAVRTREPAALDRFLSTDGGATRLDVVLADTTSLLTAMDVVRRARRLAAARPLPAGLAGARVLVGGYVAQNVDLQDALWRRWPLLLGVTLGATALVLGLVFRSVLIPLKAIVVTALSVGATLGLIVLVFQLGSDGTGAVFVAVPVLMFAVVFGLGMDYEVFLLSRVREAFAVTADTERAMVAGLGVTAGVISAAALLMIVVFAAFAFARVLIVRLLGFGLAAAVLLDASIIRLVLVPAVMQLAGRWNWWPGIRARRDS
jgi:putative drug exporter of the RND superfamily